EGWGTSASRPFGVRGVITMKMIKSTRRMSISGTTFIEAMAPPFFPPTSIPIVFAPLLIRQSCLHSAVAHGQPDLQMSCIYASKRAPSYTWTPARIDLFLARKEGARLTLTCAGQGESGTLDRKSTRLNSSHGSISYAVFCLKKKR